MPDATTKGSQTRQAILRAAIARFGREAQAVAKLDHPHIAGVHYIGQDEQLCYMALEYVDGASLRRVIDAIERDPKATIETALEGRKKGGTTGPAAVAPPATRRPGSSGGGTSRW